MKTSIMSDLSVQYFEPAFAAKHRTITEKMRDCPVWVALILPILMTAAMAWLDYATGWEVSLFIFYAAPIFLAVWWAGSWAGLFIAALSGVAWWLANESFHPYESRFGYTWAYLNRQFYFGLVVFAVKTVRTKQQADATRIQMLEERRQLEQDIVAVSEHEQQRIGQDLHDGLCQQLAAIGCAARVLADDLQAQKNPEARDAAMIEEAIQHAVLEARSLARGVFPVHVDHNGLAAALAELGQVMSRLTGVAIVAKDSAEVSVDDPEVSMHLYRIAQEAVANAVRHSGAHEITINLKKIGAELELRIEDDGTGIDKGTQTQGTTGMGLRTMRYRAQALGASLEIASRYGGGTIVRCLLNLKTNHPNADHGQN